VLHGRLAWHAVRDLVGHAEVQGDHDRVERDPETDELDAPHAQVRRAEPEQRHVGQQEHADADVLVARRREVDDLERQLQRQPDDEQPRPAEPEVGQPLEPAAGQRHHGDGDHDRHRVREHLGTVAAGSPAVAARISGGKWHPGV